MDTMLGGLISSYIRRVRNVRPVSTVDNSMIKKHSRKKELDAVRVKSKDAN